MTAIDLTRTSKARAGNVLEQRSCSKTKAVYRVILKHLMPGWQLHDKDPSFPRRRESRNNSCQCGALVKAPAIYILASRRNGTLYVGVTGDLIKRIHEHKTGLIDRFTKRYKTHSLVYFEQDETMVSAIAREKQIKKWNRKLIEARNPE